jgi:O-antigen ligase
MDRERLDNWCERGILGLVLAILVIGPLAFGATGPLSFLVLQGLTLGAMFFWGVRFWANPRLKLLWPPICWAVLAFVVYAIVRYLQADIEYVARQELIRILVYAFLFFIVLNNLHRQESMQIIVLTVIFLGMLISFYAAFQFVTKSDKVLTSINTYKGRAGGTFIYPNNLAGFLEILLPVTMAYVLVGRLSHVTKILLSYAAVVMLVGVGVTLSRGGWVVTAVVVVAFCGVLLSQRNYRIQALVLLALLVVSGFVVAPKMSIMRSRFQNSFSSGKADDLRFSIWRPASQMWLDHFWTGVGPGHFDYVFRQYRPQDVQLRPGKSHNDYLNTLADWGVVGTGIIMVAWGLLYWGVLKTWRFSRGAQDDFSRKKSSKFAFVIGASLGLLAVLIHAVVDFNMQTPAVAILAVTLMALLSSHWRFATERFWFGAGGWGRYVGTLVILSGMLFLGYQEWRGTMEHLRLVQAQRAPEFSDERIAALEGAYKFEPKNFETTYAIGECYRIQSRKGTDEYVALARKAMEWYQRGMKLDRYYGYNWLRYGMCLDWIGSPEGAWPYYEHANDLDPNGYFTSAYVGVHYIQTGDYAAARTWLERSLRLEWDGNEIATEYLPIVNRRLKEAAAAIK